jgi:hypothetical protein
MFLKATYGLCAKRIPFQVLNSDIMSSCAGLPKEETKYQYAKLSKILG